MPPSYIKKHAISFFSLLFWDGFPETGIEGFYSTHLNYKSVSDVSKLSCVYKDSFFSLH